MKTIITLDKANKPYGFPQLDGDGNFGRFLATATFSATERASIILGTNSFTNTPGAYLVNQDSDGTTFIGTGNFTNAGIGIDSSVAAFVPISVTGSLALLSLSDDGTGNGESLLAISSPQSGITSQLQLTNSNIIIGSTTIVGIASSFEVGDIILATGISPSFIGIGLNDLTQDGDYIGNDSLTWTVQVDSVNNTLLTYENISGTATYTDIHDFSNTDGWQPTSLIEVDGILYGLSNRGTEDSYFGNIFSIYPDGNSFSVVYSFLSSGFGTGAYPSHGLVYYQDYLYGILHNGGANSGGTIFSIYPNGTSFSVLYNFNISDTPQELMEYNGVLYGTTQEGGDYGYGSIFSIYPDGGSYSVIYSFDYTTGQYPRCAVIEYSGVFYGTAQNGGDFGGGVIYSIYPDGGTFSLLHSFNEFVDGSNPLSKLLEYRGILYGTTDFGGTFDSGVIFKIYPDGSSFSVIQNFDVERTEYNNIGGQPDSGLTEVDGVLYGMTNFGSLYGYGNIFSINTDGTNFKELYPFDYTSGGYPDLSNRLLLYKNTLYGATKDGGSNGYGALYSLSIPRFNIGDIITDSNSGVTGSITDRVDNLLTISGGPFSQSDLIYTSIATASVVNSNTHDTFSFSNGLTSSYNVIMSTVSNSLGLGETIRFGSEYGHTLNDSWTWTFEKTLNNVLVVDTASQSVILPKLSGIGKRGINVEYDGTISTGPTIITQSPTSSVVIQPSGSKVVFKFDSQLNYGITFSALLDSVQFGDTLDVCFNTGTFDSPAIVVRFHDGFFIDNSLIKRNDRRIFSFLFDGQFYVLRNS
jgi:hypothetical protein